MYVYRLLSYFVSPWMEMRHCLCIVGYSFYAWSAALFLTYPLEHYGTFFRLPYSLALISLGIPSALAQGYIFWEHIPQSMITIKPNTLHRLINKCITVDESWVQQAVRMMPKIVVFILISGTHYQLLWYVSRVFLPGKRQLCELQELIEPANYADILTQKVCLC